MKLRVKLKPMGIAKVRHWEKQMERQKGFPMVKRKLRATDWGLQMDFQMVKRWH